MKVFKIISKSLLLIVIGLLIYRYMNISDDNFFTAVTTFSTITVGFTITSISIIANSSFSKKLYGIDSKANNSKSLLHELLDKFKQATFLFISTIILIFILYLFPKGSKGDNFDILSYTVNDIQIVKSLILLSTIVSVYEFTRLFSIFSRFVVKSVTEN